ncbi:MAG: hypothetical protein AABX23_05040 [Nanoarchaeota archaeon]
MSSIKGFKEVFSKLHYLVLMLSSALFFYLFSVVLTDLSEFKWIFMNYDSFIFLKLLVLYFVGFPVTIGLFSAIIMILTALLFGSYISLASYKTKQVKKLQDKTSIAGNIGIFLGILAPGCVACGLGIASLFGLAGFVVALPFQGTEISVIAFLLLSFANWSIAGKVSKNTCSIRLNKRI